MVGRKLRPVHLVGEKDVVERLVDWERPTHFAEVDAACDDVGVETLRKHVDRGLRDPGALENLGERDAAPFGHAHRAESPLRSGRRRALLSGKEAAPVSGALNEGGQLLRP